MRLCSDDAAKLDYLNGTLSERERTAFEEHLVACPGCRLEIVHLRTTAIAVRGLTLPAVPADWTDAAKERLRARRASVIPAVPSRPAPRGRWTDVSAYALTGASAIAGLVLVFRLVMGGMIQRWLPGLSAAALGISEPGAARTAELVAWIVSLHALVLLPSVIDSLYVLVWGSGRRKHPGRSYASFAR